MTIAKTKFAFIAARGAAIFGWAACLGLCCQAGLAQAASPEEDLENAQYEAAIAIADELLASSRDGYHKLTVNLTELAFSVNTACDLKIRISLRRKDNEAYRAALNERVDEWEANVKRLEAFPYQFAAGWRGDLSQARSWQALAKMALASAEKEPKLEREALREGIEHAAQVVIARHDDYILAQAGFRELFEAADIQARFAKEAAILEKDQAARLEAASDHLTTIEKFVEEVDKFVGKPAEAGRPDFVAWAHAQQNTLRGQLAELQGQTADAIEAYRETASEAHKMYDLRREYYEAATSTPFELAEASTMAVLAEVNVARLSKQPQAQRDAWKEHIARLDEAFLRGKGWLDANEFSQRTRLLPLLQCASTSARLVLLPRRTAAKPTRRTQR